MADEAEEKSLQPVNASIASILRSINILKGKEVMIKGATMEMTSAGSSGYRYEISDGSGKMTGVTRAPKPGKADVKGVVKVTGEGSPYIEF